jgi:3-hydroxyisobutyrate dehydrogenase
VARVAFLGLGAIGRPMAHHLAAGGDDLAVWNRTSARASTFVSEHPGTRHATTPAEAADGGDVVITCLPTSRDVESLLHGKAGLLATMRPDSVLVDCTSGDPATSRTIAAELEKKGIRFLDAPVSGGVAGAERGKLTIMVGGDPAILDRVRPVLSKLGEKIVHCGPVGAGHALKAVNQYLLGVHIWSLAEGLAVLARSGVSAATALDVINASSGRSNVSQNLFPERVLTRAFPRTFRLALLDKDVAIAAEAAREHAVPTPVLQLTAELMRTAHAILGEEADHVEATRVVEQWAQVEIT